MRTGRIAAETAKNVVVSLDTDLSSSGGVVSTKTVSSNSVGFGAVLCPDASGELIEALVGTIPSRAGLFLALQTGTGELQVLEWGGGHARNDAWTFTPGQPLYLSSVAGEFSETGTAGKEAGYVVSATEIVFGPVPDTFVEGDVRIVVTHTGQTFEALLEVDAGATVLWEFDDDTTSDSLTPSKDFGTAATRTTYLTVTPKSALTLADFGYDGGDGGDAYYGAAYYLDQQNVTEITNLSGCTGLVALMVKSNPIDNLDVRGLAALEVLECNECTELNTLLLSGNVGLIRASMEAASVDGLDISGCTSLRDIRCGSNGNQNLTWGAVGPTVRHICVNQNPDLNQIPDVSRFTTLEEFLTFGSGQSGALIFASAALAGVSIENNEYTELDVSCTTLLPVIYAANNLISDVDLGANNDLYYVDLSDNPLSQAFVDYVFAFLAGNSVATGTVDMRNTTAPSATGLANAAILEARGWTVYYDASSNPYIVEDGLFPADNATGVAVDTSFSITFNEIVNAVSGYIEIYDSLDALVEVFDVTTDITGDGTTEISFTPTSPLSEGTDYYVLIDSTAFVDSESNPFDGISESTTWNFTTVSGSTNLFEDYFTRSDGPVGNDWLTYLSPNASIVSEELFINQDGYACLYHECSGTLPADYTFSCTVPHSMVSRSEWGVGVRCIMDGVPELVGTRIFFDASNPITAGNTKAWNADPITVTVTNGFPASWPTDQDHTVAIQCIGTTITIILDGQEYGYLTSSINNTTGTGICFLGNPGGWAHHFDNAVVTVAA